jgi:hypothetical protein
VRLYIVFFGTHARIAETVVLAELGHSHMVRSRRLRALKTASHSSIRRDTVGQLAASVGHGCERLHDRLMRDLQVSLVELDEQWDFIGKKQKRVVPDDPAEFGDVWLFQA